MAKIFSELKARDRALLWLAYNRRRVARGDRFLARRRAAGVKVMLFRARRRLRDLLQARGLVNS